MAIKIASWNIEGRLTRFAESGDRGSPEHIIDGITKLNADILFLPEASDGNRIEPDINYRLEQLGYEITTVSYNDGGKSRRWAAEVAPNMKLLTRLEKASFRQVRLGDIRNALVVTVIDSASGEVIRILGIHLDDRNEAYRLRQAEDLLVLLKESSLPTITMGDFNAMHGEDFRSQVLRSRYVRKTIALWPHARTKSVFQRLSEMASGDTLTLLESESMLTAVDTYHCATTTPKMRNQEWMPSIRIAQIDHIYVSPGVTVADFNVGKDGGSDHRPISAIIEINRTTG